MPPIDDTTIIQPQDWTRELDLSSFFNESRPLELDLGCGKGRFLVARAASHPRVNFLGVDRLIGRLHKVNRKLVHNNLDNVRLLRIEGAYAVTHLFPPQSIQTLYILFPDPWPKRRHHRRRLVNPAFLASASRILEHGARIHCATDHADYFTQIERSFGEITEFTRVDPFLPTEDEQTDFERIFVRKGDPIGRCSFVFDG